jgi:hypothetical protein
MTGNRLGIAWVRVRNGDRLQSSERTLVHWLKCFYIIGVIIELCALIRSLQAVQINLAHFLVLN